MHFEQNKLLSTLSTFGIGGPAVYFIEIRSAEEMCTTLQFCHQKALPFFIMGKGSNCLFSDQGFDGLVILNKIDFHRELQPGVFHVGAGYSFSLLGTQTARQGWSGLEFASGIPASVGGAVYMNAGANGTETCESLLSVDFVDSKGTLHTFLKSELHFEYRTSSFQNLSGAIVGATFQLKASPTAREKQLSIIRYRQQTQPYGQKSAGCVFRNPDCAHAGALIDRSGLKGLAVGGAQVSPLHANFIVNHANATTLDVLSLIALVQNKVAEATGIHLESEIRIIPYSLKGTQ